MCVLICRGHSRCALRRYSRKGMSSFTIFLVGFTALLGHCTCQSGEFVYPPPPQGVDVTLNPVYTVGDSIRIEWTAENASTITLRAYQSQDNQQANGAENFCVFIEGGDPSKNSWEAGIGIEPGGREWFDLSQGNVVQFVLLFYGSTDSDPTGLAYSEFVNLTDTFVNAQGQTVSSTTAALYSAASVSTSWSMTALQTIVSYTTSVTVNAVATSSSNSTVALSNPSVTPSSYFTAATSSPTYDGLSTSDKIGIGVGVGVGVPVILILATLLFLAIRSSTAADMTSRGSYTPAPWESPSVTHHWPPKDLTPYEHPIQLPEHGDPSEMPGDEGYASPQHADA